MEQRIVNVRVRRRLTREEIKRRKLWRIAENAVTVLMGLGAAAVLFWAGWMVGSGALW